MEGSHDTRDIMSIINMTFEPYKNLDEVKRQATVLKYITLISSIDTPALLEDVVFEVPYLSSGCPGTADYNCYKMSKAVRLLWRIHSGIPLEDAKSEDAFIKHFGHLQNTKDLVKGLMTGAPLLEIFKFFGMKLEPVNVITDFQELYRT